MRTCVRTKEHSCQDYTTIGVTKKGIRHGNYWWMRFKTHLLRLYLLEYNLFSCYNNGEVCVFIPILSYLFLNAILKYLICFDIINFVFLSLFPISLSLFILKLIFIGVQLLHNGVLVSTVQQDESAIHIHRSPPFWTSFPFRSPFTMSELSGVPCTVYSMFPLVIYFMHSFNSIYVSMPVSQLLPLSPCLLSPLVSTYLFTMSSSLFLLYK